MKDNKHPHPHAALIKHWLDDRNTVFEEFNSKVSGVIDVGAVLYDMHGERQIRVRNVNLIKGHWYPCSCSGYVSVKMWNGDNLIAEEGDNEGVSPSSFDKIGKSLGEIKFGD